MSRTGDTVTHPIINWARHRLPLCARPPSGSPIWPLTMTVRAWLLVLTSEIWPLQSLLNETTTTELPVSIYSYRPIAGQRNAIMTLNFALLCDSVLLYLIGGLCFELLCRLSLGRFENHGQKCKNFGTGQTLKNRECYLTQLCWRYHSNTDAFCDLLPVGLQFSTKTGLVSFFSFLCIALYAAFAFVLSPLCFVSFIFSLLYFCRLLCICVSFCTSVVDFK